MSRLWDAPDGASRRPTRGVVFLLAVLATFTVFRMVRVDGWDDAFYVAEPSLYYLRSITADG